MYDTTPEDWNREWYSKCVLAGHKCDVKEKQPGIPLGDYIGEYDAVFAFNSLVVMKAIEIGKAVYTTHGVIRNSDMLGKVAPYYDLDALKKYYEPKQFTLEEIADLGVKCLN
jgi:hypothetical protein